MKKVIILLTMFCGFLSTGKLLSQNVAINADGSAPVVSAMLDIKSTTKGLLIPRMTTLQRTAIPAPAIGLKVFDLNTRSFHYYNGAKWIEIASVPAINYWTPGGNNVYNNTGYVGIGTNIPASRLHLVGNEASVPLRIQNKLVTGQSGIQFFNSSGVVTGHLGYANTSSPIFTNSFYAGSISNAPFIFTTNNIERMRIDNAGSIGMGTAAIPALSAILDIKSTTKGLLIPRMTLGQRNLIVTPATSLLIFQTDNTPGYYFYNGASWIPITSGSSTNSWSLNGNNIFNNNTGNAGIGTNTPTNKLTVQTAYDNYGITHTDGTVRISSYIGRGGGAWFGTQSNNDFHLYTNNNGTPNITFHPNFNTDIRGVKPRLIFFDETGGIVRSSGDLKSNLYNLEIAASKIGPLGIPGNLILQAGEVLPELYAGNVGVGTRTPAYKFQVEQNGWGIMQTNGSLRAGFYVAGGGGWLATQSFHPLYFSTGLLNGNNVAQMMIATNGNVGIGSLNPADKLTVRTASDNYGLTHTDGTITAGSKVGGGAGWFGTKSNHPLNFFTNNGNAQMAIQPNGQVSIKGGPGFFGNPTLTVSSANSSSGGLALTGVSTIYEWRFSVDANNGELDFWRNDFYKASVNADGDWNSASDESLKENITPYKSVLGNIKSLHVSTYRYKSNAPDSRSFGLMAQNVAQYFPEIVSETQDKDGRKLLGIAYGKTGVLAIKAIQEQQVIIEAQQKKIETQLRKIDDLEKRMMVLENLLNK